MKWLKAITTEGEVEYFNTSQILNIRPRKCGDVVILMGAGLYWHIRPETMVYVTERDLIGEVMGK